MTEQLRRLDLTDLLGLGLSPKTAYTYSRIWAKVEPLLEARGVDWLTCTAADIGAIAAGWPASSVCPGSGKPARCLDHDCDGELGHEGKHFRAESIRLLGLLGGPDWPPLLAGLVAWWRRGARGE